MQQKPKDRDQAKNKKTETERSWEEDQKRRGYYYDDSHGYETYDPESDSSEAELEENSDSDQA